MRQEPGAEFQGTKSPDIRHQRTNFVSPLPRPKKTIKRLFFFMVGVALLGGVILTQQVFFSSQTVPVLKELTRLPVVREIRQLTGASDGELKGESRDRINVLVMGQGGVGHPGPYLTDTMMLMSFKPSTGQIALLSIPRDLVSEIPGYGLERINAANAYGETSGYPGGGAALAARVVEDMLSLPVNYYARVDFSGFEKFIDELNGVELEISRAFTDFQYPDNNYGYQTVHFEAGLQTLNGARALQYVRSRHAEGNAGDFARVQRQQNLLLALKDEVLTPGIFLNPGKLIKLYQSLEQNLATNAQVWEIPLFLNLAKQADFDNLTFKVLDDSPAGPLYATTLQNGAYVLAPKISDYSEIQFIAKNLFTIGEIKKEASKLVIQNGTGLEGLALNTAAIFSAFEFTVVKVSNAPSKDFDKTLLYDLTGDTKSNSKKFLESTLQTRSLTSLPLTEDELGEADFLIILGRDQLPSAQVNQSEFLNNL